MLKEEVIGNLIHALKVVYKYVINILNTLLYLFHSEITYTGSFLYHVKIRVAKKNSVHFENTRVSRSLIEINGSGNIIDSKNSLIESCQVSIKGTNNQLKVLSNVKLRNATIHIRGSNCKIIIGEKTSFGQVRIVNAGEDNDIIIGKDCMFADNIEIWASDTHSIYDADGNFINHEKPIIIGDKVWIGSHVKILKGVTIGDNVIVGMNSMITKNLRSNTIYAGNPPRELKSVVTWSSNYRGV